MSNNKKTILIDILHPAHVHFFRNVIHELKMQGHKVVITARAKEISIELLEVYNLNYHLISRQRNGIMLLWEMIIRTMRLIAICLREKPDLLMGIMGPSIALTGFLLRIPRWIFYDTENAWMTNCFAYPLATRIYTPQCYMSSRRKNETRYPGYHELAYLHPQRFHADKNIVAKYSIDTGSPYVIVRFVSWQASHDAGEKGLSMLQKEKLVKQLEQYATVYISSESPLPENLSSRRLDAAIEDIHHLLAFARLVVGESATMASEAAVLGTKAVFISDTKRGYTLEQEKLYHLVCNYSCSQLQEVFTFIDREFSDPASTDKAASAHRQLLRDRIDVTSFILDEISSKITA
jgi:predicted glycosyltransferase